MPRPLRAAEGEQASMGEHRYTHGHQDAVLRSHRWRTAENSAGYLLGLLRPGMRVLDVGCGPGTITADLAVRVAPGAVVGIDLSAAVVEEASVHARERGVDNVSFVHSDVRTLEPGAEPFDVVHAHQVLQNVPDPVEVLRAMMRLAVPGGVVAVRDADYGGMTWAPDEPRLDRWLAVYRSVMRRNGAEPDGGRWLPRWARQAGLREVSYTTSTWTFATPAARHWWGSLWAERIVASSAAEQAVAYGIATPDELADMAAGWQQWAACPDGVFTVVHGEVIARAPTAPLTS